jgi:hypothetical protein
MKTLELWLTVAIVLLLAYDVYLEYRMVNKMGA